MCRGGTAGLVYVIGRKLFANHHTHAADGVRHVAAKIVITIAGKKIRFSHLQCFPCQRCDRKMVGKESADRTANKPVNRSTAACLDSGYIIAITCREMAGTGWQTESLRGSS